MQLEFHQLDRRWEHLRVRQPHRQGRLAASLAESGQQTPIVVVAAADHSGRYVVIDGHKRIAALEQLGRDTVEATVWAMSEAEALLLERSLRFSPQESALEQGWLLSEMEQRFGYSLEELARRFDRSVSWVSRRLALVDLLPEAIQQQVREGALGAGLAMKYLVPVARVNLEHCQRMAAAFVQHRCNTRQERAQSPALELHPRAGNPAGGESRTLPATDPRAFERLQGIGQTPVVPAGQYHFDPGVEMQHDTSPHAVEVGGKKYKAQTASAVLC
jgi:ParB/RepB/Spo0J family partition protein